MPRDRLPHPADPGHSNRQTPIAPEAQGGLQSQALALHDSAKVSKIEDGMKITAAGLFSKRLRYFTNIIEGFFELRRLRTDLAAGAVAAGQRQQVFVIGRFFESPSSAGP